MNGSESKSTVLFLENCGPKKFFKNHCFRQKWKKTKNQNLRPNFLWGKTSKLNLGIWVNGSTKHVCTRLRLVRAQMGKSSQKIFSGRLLSYEHKSKIS